MRVSQFNRLDLPDSSKCRCPVFEIGELHLISKVSVETPEYVQERLIKSVHNLMVVVVDFHFQVHSGVLGEVPVGVRVLRAKDRSDFVHPPHITRNAHLFGELRTLDANRECLAAKGLGREFGPERDKRADGNNPL